MKTKIANQLPIIEGHYFYYNHPSRNGLIKGWIVVDVWHNPLFNELIFIVDREVRKVAETQVGHWSELLEKPKRRAKLK